MKKLVSLSPEAINFLRDYAKLKFGTSEYKFSAAIEMLIDDYKKLSTQKEIKKEIKELKEVVYGDKEQV